MPLFIDCADVKVIVVVETEATKQVPVIPVPETDIPTKIFGFAMVMTTVVIADVVPDVTAVVEEEIVLAIKEPVV